MIVFVDLTHDLLRQEPPLWSYFTTRILETKYRLEAFSGQPCLIVRYDRVSPALLAELNAQAVVVSGNYTAFKHYSDDSLAGLRAVYYSLAWPMLCFCGGFQLLAQAHGAEIGPMGPLSPGQPLPGMVATPLPPSIPARPLNSPATMPLAAAVASQPVSSPAAIAAPASLPLSPDTPGPFLDDPAISDIKHERGFMPVRVVQAHPLFAGLGPEPVFFQLHSWEVKMAPPGFEVLAQTDLCGIQTIAHRERPIFGTQYHPELYDEAHPDGQQLVRNFCKIAGIANSD